VLYPYVKTPQILIAISNEGYMKYKDTMAEDSILVYEKDLVKIAEHGPNVKAFGIPATRFAEELGRKIVLNIVMLGFFGAVTGLVPKEALREAVQTSVPSGTEEFNLKAFDRGFEYGTELLAKA
jgi:2-oxoglutarate ferredoxin oxidoreductase subunit gamma